MPHDIFISYSRKDSEHALTLAERLRAEGLEIWIDWQGIVGAEKWATEIVEGINGCTTFILLLSPQSIESENVLRELSLASEKRKRVLPVDLEPTLLPASFEYPLAGLQRVAITEFDKILHAHKHGLEKIIKKDERKSLMILPFEDISPTGDNAWFADGIVSELISALSPVKALRVADASTTKEYKGFRGHLSDYAREMNIRYFVQGDVRKFGDAIKITSRLLDVQTGDQLWQDSMKGTMDDIFTIQESVATNVLQGLTIVLTAAEQQRLDTKPTTNAEAYELWLKGREYFNRATRDDLRRALQLYDEAVRLDPAFANAHLSIAIASLDLYRKYVRDHGLLERASEQITHAELVLGPSKEILRARSILSGMLGDREESVELAQAALSLDPEYASAHDALALAFESLGKFSEAADARQRGVELRGDSLLTHFNYLSVLNALDDPARLVSAARAARPICERHLRLNPDDINSRVHYAVVLSLAEDHEAAIKEARLLEQTAGIDGAMLYNLACLFVREGDYRGGMRVLRTTIERGYTDIETITLDQELDPLRSIPEFEELMIVLQKRIVSDSNG